MTRLRYELKRIVRGDRAVGSTVIDLLPPLHPRKRWRREVLLPTSRDEEILRIITKVVSDWCGYPPDVLRSGSAGSIPFYRRRIVWFARDTFSIPNIFLAEWFNKSAAWPSQAYKRAVEDQERYDDYGKAMMQSLGTLISALTCIYELDSGNG